MDALKCDSGPFAFYGAAVFGFTRTFFRFYHTSCPRTLKTSEPSQTLLWILLWQHLFNPCEERGSFCVCVSFFCVCLLCVCAFIWKYLCLPVAHNMCLCASHLVSSRASCVCMIASSPLGACPPHFTCLPPCLPSYVLLPSKLTSPCACLPLGAFTLNACLRALAKFNRPTEHNTRLQFLCIPGWEKKLGKNFECFSKIQTPSSSSPFKKRGKIVGAVHITVRGPNPLWNQQLLFHCWPTSSSNCMRQLDYAMC